MYIHTVTLPGISVGDDVGSLILVITSTGTLAGPAPQVLIATTVTL